MNYGVPSFRPWAQGTASNYGYGSRPPVSGYGYGNSYGKSTYAPPSLVSRLTSGIQGIRDRAGSALSNSMSPTTSDPGSESPWGVPAPPNYGAAPTQTLPSPYGFNTSQQWQAPTPPTYGTGSTQYSPYGSINASAWPAPAPPNSGSGPTLSSPYNTSPCGGSDSRWGVPGTPGMGMGMGLGTGPTPSPIGQNSSVPNTGASPAASSVSQTSGKKSVSIAQPSIDHKETPKVKPLPTYADPDAPLTSFKVESMAVNMRPQAKAFLYETQGTATNEEIDRVARGWMYKELGEALNTVEWQDEKWRTHAEPPPDEIRVKLNKRTLGLVKSHILSGMSLKNSRTGEEASDEAKSQWFEQRYSTTEYKVDRNTPEDLSKALAPSDSGPDLSQLTEGNPQRTKDLLKIAEEITAAGGSEADVNAAWKSKFGTPPGTEIDKLEGGAAFRGLTKGTATAEADDGSRVTVSAGDAFKFRPEGTKLNLDPSIPHPYYADKSDIAFVERLEKKRAAKKKAQAAEAASNSSKPPSQPSTSSSGNSARREMPPSKNGAKTLSDISSKPKPEKPMSWSGLSLDEWVSSGSDEAGAQKRGEKLVGFSKAFQKIGIDSITSIEASSRLIDAMTATEAPDIKSFFTEIADHVTARGTEMTPEKLMKALAPSE